MKNKIVNGFFYTLLVLYVLHIIFLYIKLPAAIVLHYNGEGKPDNWGNKGIFVLIQLLLLLLPLGFELLMKFFDKIPQSLINLGNKEYWLSDGKIQETKQYLIMMFRIFSIIYLTYIILIFSIVYNANITNTTLNMTIFIPALVIFLITTLVWTVVLLAKFYTKPRGT